MTKKVPFVKNIIAVASGKGGVGKSTTSVNLAVALSLSGLKVGLLDADIYGPSGPQMMGVEDKSPTATEDDRIDPVMNHGIKTISMGFMLEEGTPVVWRGPMVAKAMQQFVFDVNWGSENDQLDVLVVDMPPGTGDIQLSLSQNVDLAGAIIVSTPQDVALLDAIKALNMFKRVNVPVLGMVENMSTFCCPKCGEETAIFSHGGAAKAAQKEGLDLLAEIPLTLGIRENTDAGKPVLLSMPDSAEAAAFRTLGENVQKALANQAAKAAAPVKVVIE